MAEIEIIEPHSIVLTPVDEVRDFPRRLELAGRTCYKSEGKITSTSSAAFIERILRSGHHSVLEHCSITVKIVGDRSMSHQLVRHRIAAYSQESMRYCDYTRDKYGGKLQVVLPPTVAARPVEPVGKEVLASGMTVWGEAVLHAYIAYVRLREAGVPAEDARSVLPQATKTEVVTTFNIRQWRHVFKLRALDAHAQWQIRRLMMGILGAFNDVCPSLFSDLIPEDGRPYEESFRCVWQGYSG